MSQYESFYGGGGGFVQGGSPFSQTGSPGGAQRSEASMSLRPINARLFFRTEQAHGDAPWSLDNFEIGHVTMVGQLVQRAMQSTNHVYYIEDGYGRVEARHWVGTSGNADAEVEKWSDIAEGIYVRVSGFLKSFGNKKYINASHMRPVKDHNEVAFHFAECVTVTLTLQRGPSYHFGTNKQKAIGGGTSAYQLNNTSMDTQDEYSLLPALQQQIVRYLISQDAKDGLHVATIARGLGMDKSEAQKLSEALDALMDGGHLYNTIDETHFAVSR